MFRRLAPIALAALSAVACAAPAEEDGSEAAAQSSASGPKLCAAVRGNGELVLMHFASLAQIVDHYGVIDGMAGGSSGSLTTFTYESILLNPAMASCNGAACDDDGRAARVALALKSVQGYAEVVEGSPEVDSVKGLVSVIGKIKKGYDDKGIGALSPGEFVEAASRLKDVLSVPEVRALVNPEVFSKLADPLHLAFNVGEIKTTISQLGAFKVDDNRLFFRTGVLNWKALATLFGRVGDFYAGYNGSDVEGMSAWLDACAPATRNMPWADAAKVAMPSGGTCGDAFTKLVTDYRAKVRSGAATGPSRIDDRIGDGRAPLRKVVSTAVLEGDATTAYETALASYAKGSYATGSIPFSPSFDDVKFGYWGSDTDIAKVMSTASRSNDLKTQKRTSLGNATWREILAASPAEPGLSPFVKLADGRYSAGGWSDLAPSLVLKDMGCGRVVYVTREGDESKFATAIAKFAGMSERQWGDLYDLSNPQSSYARSVASADGVWCTKWNDYNISTMDAGILDAFGSPLETRAGLSRVAPLHPYANATPRTGRIGCTPGLAGDATYPR